MINKVYYALETGAFTDSSTQGLRIASFDFPKPEVKTTYIDVPGRNGLIDLSESLTGGPVYSNITGSITFIVLKGSGFDLKSFVNTYHGRIMRLYTDEDTTHYYVGRATVTARTLKLGSLQTFTLTVNAEPFLWDMTESSQSFSIKTGSTSIFTQVATANMAAGYPKVVTKKITIQFEQSYPPTLRGYADYTFPVDDSKLYVLACNISSSAVLNNTNYSITTGNGTVYGTELIKPKAGDTTATVRFYTSTDGYDVVFDNICLIELQEVQRSAALGVSAPYILSNRAGRLYVFQSKDSSAPVEYPVSANTPCYVPDINVRRQDSGGQTGIYIGLGLASSNGTADMKYRGGVLA